MKKLFSVLIVVSGLPFFSYPGGIITNQNQSAAYIRMFARDASINIDAVFYNPAGLTKLADGFYLSVNNQYISQDKSVMSDYMNLTENPTEYKGEIRVPLFPGIYSAYKKGKIAISFGWNPVGGGGGATFSKGLPSFEIPVSDLVPTLSAQGQPVSAYSLDAYFEGRSVFWGYQLGASYEFNDIFSVYLGARYVSAKNTYSGHLKDIMITYAGSEIPASTFFGGNANLLQPLYDGLNNLSDGGAGSLTLDQALASTIITPDEYAGLAGGYASLGLSPSLNTVDEGFAVAEPSYLGARRAQYVLADQENVEVEQKGSGIAPIVGFNISPGAKLNIGLKYEFKTKLELENNTTTDFITDYDPVTEIETGMFPDKEKNRSDMPALISAGFSYKITDKLLIASGFHMYFDKDADYGKKINGTHVDNSEIINRNLTEYALGLEYVVSDKLLLSIGYLNTQTGVSEDYQTDLSYSQHSNTVGIGGAYSISQLINLNVGIGYTVYNDARKIYEISDALGNSLTTTESYDKDNLFIALALDFSFNN